jgi:hypothetical protein
MPKLYRNSTGGYYTKSLNQDRQVITLQIRREGAQWLLDSGYREGSELGAAFWDLVEYDWLYTRGDTTGGGEIGLSVGWVQHDALADSPPLDDLLENEPLTIPCDDEYGVVPRFLYAPNKSIYYTILHVENSSDAWLQVPLLIKHRGAMELLRLGASVGEEFTEEGLKLIFQRRWGYFDDERMP